MSPARSRTGAYRPPRQRREVALAVLGVLAVLVVTGVLIWVLAPEDQSTTPSTPTVTVPTSTGDTSVTTTPVPTTTASTTVPG